MKPEFARKLISQQTGVPEKNITIEDKKISSVGNAVIVDANVQLAFVLQPAANGQWHILKIGRINGQWEDPATFQLLRAQSAFNRSLQAAMLTAVEKP